MQIQRFNPIMDVETFQKTMQSDVAEEVIKNAAFVALASNKPEELVTGLNTDLASKVNHYVKERTKRITEFVRGLNALGDSRDDLLLSNPHFQESKEALKAARTAYFTLNGLDRGVLAEMKDSFQMNSLELAKMTKFAKYYRNCCEQSPIAILEDALSVLDSQSKDEEEQQKKIDGLKEAIQNCFLELGISFDLIAHMTRYNKYESEVLNIFEEQVPSMLEEAKHIHVKRKDEIEASKKMLLVHLNSYLSCHDELVKDSAYTRYFDGKKKVSLELEELAGFCKFEELSNHAKITSQSVDLLSRFKRLLG